ncbi:conjugative transposon protein TraJ [Pedobacter puniceum]|uniref:Conjugative transposon protein TraJ n=1 Tax=Pedobacter puniceum TaxID=2666136 RepID=A0A7K0FLZ9_9SPHI|nr:conjugative transposon protein TraJ [Pedobacter puniceum]MRX46953.1 conjugative transposon protein TraJ [Pedobacter puniceum]
MRNFKYLTIFLMVSGIILPEISFAQTISGGSTGLQQVLDSVYIEMLPLCSKLIDVARGIAGFAALWYIGSRVWKHIAAAEPIDFYPLLRPFALGLAIMLFPSVIDLMNGILNPIVSTTNSMVTDSNKAIAVLLHKKAEATKNSRSWQMYVGEDGSGDREKWYKYTNSGNGNSKDEGLLEGLGNDMRFWMDKQSYNFRNTIKQWMSEVLQLLYEAAALCINTIRTFYLIVLAILGPLVFGFSVFDGFQHTLTVWIARYVNVFLWLPVANIFSSILGKIQENMLQLDISQVQSSGDTFFSPTDTAYLIFMLIGIVGYFTVPGVANYIVHAGGGNSLLSRVNSMMSKSGGTVVSTTKSGMGMAADALGNQWQKVSKSHSAFGANSNYFNSDKDNNSPRKNRLSGN